MSVSFGSFSRFIPAIQVTSRLNKNKLILFNNGLSETRGSIVGLPCRSVFLVQFLSQRCIGSSPSVPALVKSRLAEIQPSITISQLDELQDDSKFQADYRPICSSKSISHVNLHSFRSIQPVNSKIAWNCGGSSLQNGFNTEINYINLYCFSPGTNRNPVITEFEKRMILMSDLNKEPDAEPPKNEGGKPTPEQLQHVHDVLADTLRKLFTHPLDYKIYHPNIVFENNIRGTRTVGIYHYVKQVALLRIIGHLKFAYVRFDILKITSHPEDGSVKVRWRISGISGLKVFLMFWKINMMKFKESIEKQQESWYDGFSTFYVDSNGLVYKHVVDKMQPDPEQKVEPSQPTLATKLALMLGLTPRECLELAHIVSFINDNTECLSDVMLPLDKIQ